MILASAVDDVVREAIATLPLPPGVQLVGALLTGSYALGYAGPESDIDLLAIVREPIVWRSFHRCGGYEIDLFAYGSRVVTRKLRDLEQPLVRIVAHSVVLVDPHGEAARVQALAQELMLGPAPELHPLVVERFRHRIFSELDDARATLHHDPDLAVALVTAQLPVLVDVFFGLRRAWRIGLRRGLPALRAMDAELADLVLAVMSVERPCAQRVDAFAAALDRALAGVGGERRYFTEFISDERHGGR